MTTFWDHSTISWSDPQILEPAVNVFCFPFLGLHFLKPLSKINVKYWCIPWKTSKIHAWVSAFPIPFNLFVDKLYLSQNRQHPPHFYSHTITLQTQSNSIQLRSARPTAQLHLSSQKTFQDSKPTSSGGTNSSERVAHAMAWTWLQKLRVTPIYTYSKTTLCEAIGSQRQH